MNKKIFYIIMISFFGLRSMAQTITDLRGNNISLDTLVGKKLMVVILPLQQDTAVSGQILRFQQRYGDSLHIIGLAISGHDSTNIDSTAALYTPLMDAGVIVTGGIVGADSATDVLPSVLQYLTRLSQNRDQETAVTGSKYFLSETGTLYANGGYVMNLDSSLVNNVIHTIVP